MDGATPSFKSLVNRLQLVTPGPNLEGDNPLDVGLCTTTYSVWRSRVPAAREWTAPASLGHVAQCRGLPAPKSVVFLRLHTYLAAVGARQTSCRTGVVSHPLFTLSEDVPYTWNVCVRWERAAKEGGGRSTTTCKQEPAAARKPH